MLDGLEITQFTYFQQCGGLDLEPISVELTYGMERIAAFLQNVKDVYEVLWNKSLIYGDLRRTEELELSVYDFELADAANCRKVFDLYEAEALRLLEAYRNHVGVVVVSPGDAKELLEQIEKEPLAGLDHWRRRFPLRKVYELCLKCSHLFNILDARGAISVTERVALIARIRKMACEVARIYVNRMAPITEALPA